MDKICVLSFYCLHKNKVKVNGVVSHLVNFEKYDIIMIMGLTQRHGTLALGTVWWFGYVTQVCNRVSVVIR